MKQFHDDYANLQRDTERSGKKHSSEAEMYRTQLAQLSSEVSIHNTTVLNQMTQWQLVLPWNLHLILSYSSGT